MECKGDDVVSNPSDAPKNDQAPTPTLDQDQEGDGEGFDDDDDGTVELLLMEIQALRIEKLELLLRLNDACKKLHRSGADNRSLWATCQGLEDEVKTREAREEELQQVVKALGETKTRLEIELAGFRSRFDGHLEIQGEHDSAVAAMERDLKVSWVVATVAAAVAVAVYLRKVRQR